MPASQDAVDPTVVELEYNNALLRDANPGEVANWVDGHSTVETFLRSIQASAEHLQVMADYVKQAVDLGKAKGAKGQDKTDKDEKPADV